MWIVRKVVWQSGYVCPCMHPVGIQTFTLPPTRYVTELEFLYLIET